MTKMIVYVNGEGRVVGAVRGDPIQVESGTLRAHVPQGAPGEARLQSPEKPQFTYYEIEVHDNLLDRETPDELHRELEQRVASLRAEG